MKVGNTVGYFYDMFLISAGDSAGDGFSRKQGPE